MFSLLVMSGKEIAAVVQLTLTMRNESFLDCVCNQQVMILNAEQDAG